ncbi:homoserine O-succinyltransferase [Tepidamorphus sp. 3E244]|uniref:homoserine O-succinyltransferase MetA n=1 Tax=Tepidamorphus sp. 3E244 TaxID=3385498 RepID=UPI0038FD3DFE
MITLSHSNLEVALPNDAWGLRPWPRRRSDNRTPVLEIGLVNNMPDAALLATERQFIRVVKTAAAGRPVRMHLFSLPGVPRSLEAQARMLGFYHDASKLPEWDLDALIVTGSEPREATLPDEPYWNELTSLIDWAAANTVSTVWSCLAAHAAVLHLHGIERRHLGTKCSGVFACNLVADDPLLARIADPVKVTHSRWNGLDEADLEENGYRVLTRSAEVGIDIFTKDMGSNFLFLQGHPEYEATSLLREYRRDVGRFLSGESRRYPDLPTDYFSPAAQSDLLRLRARAHVDRDSVSMEDFDAFEPRDGLANELAGGASLIFCNWFDKLLAQRSGTQEPAASQG